MLSNYHKGFRSVYLFAAHIVLTTKYRRKVLTAEMLERLAAIAGDVCQRWGATLLECNGEADHVHLLIDYPPDVAMSKFVSNLKTVTSRLLRKEFPQLQRAYSKPVLWTGAYFAASCGGVTIEQLKRYVENQGTE